MLMRTLIATGLDTAALHGETDRETAELAELVEVIKLLELEQRELIEGKDDDDDDANETDEEEDDADADEDADEDGNNDSAVDDDDDEQAAGDCVSHTVVAVPDREDAVDKDGEETTEVALADVHIEETAVLESAAKVVEDTSLRDAEENGAAKDDVEKRLALEDGTSVVERSCSATGA
mmetsp:Transcript_23977/g.59987  ORF Transcript_23977/g.59987 Transcript_23977/m.59987 type:complete len:179 (+) Transcript_23977:917-1453(+)